MSGVGSIRGKLVLVVGDAELQIGTVSLPLKVTRVCPEGKSRMAFGLGVDLESVTETVQAIFAEAVSGDE